MTSLQLQKPWFKSGSYQGYYAESLSSKIDRATFDERLAYLTKHAGQKTKPKAILLIAPTIVIIGWITFAVIAAGSFLDCADNLVDQNADNLDYDFGRTRNDMSCAPKSALKYGLVHLGGMALTVIVFGVSLMVWSSAQAATFKASDKAIHELNQKDGERGLFWRLCANRPSFFGTSRQELIVYLVDANSPQASYDPSFAGLAPPMLVAYPPSNRTYPVPVYPPQQLSASPAAYRNDVPSFNYPTPAYAPPRN
ncbi:hypothetical protein BC832DRAFT_67660 [Gaertneriomyces semiglobifer]|nr:hypothetical protein BC832DRAFT_67660 [Gaertneriomyces semiglobifer]